jgi:uncharacterized protein YndB with AHSA1/START domain
VSTRVAVSLHSEGGKGVVRIRSEFNTGVDDLWSALTDPKQLDQWYGKVQGDLRVGGEFTAFVHGSQWDGRGRVDQCEPPRRFRLYQAEGDGPETTLDVDVSAAGDDSILRIEVRGLPLEMLFAFGAGWQAHIEDLADHLAGTQRDGWPASWLTRWEELAPSYREMTLEPL